MAETIGDLLERGGDAAAIGAPGRPPLSFDGLKALAADVVTSLNAHGIGRGDRVAIVLPNGPEMAAAFVTVASAATAAPLNPAYRGEEFEFYLTDLKPKAVIVKMGETSPVRDAAVRLGTPVIELHPDGDGSGGRFRLDLTPLAALPAEKSGAAEPADVALVLHTSGTTARPKIVPLSNANLVASARHIGATLGLTAGDRCLNIMPLFHIHGLIAAVLSSLAAEASVWCTPGFNALRFFSLVEEVKPTWYTAVPTMHQAILARAGHNADKAKAAHLRLIRSSSASLPPQVMLALEETFGCPVVEITA